MRVFVSADMEGATGVCHRDHLVAGGQDYGQARKWLTGDVNAAVEGALAAGATEVVVADGHATMRNILLDELHEAGRLVAYARLHPPGQKYHEPAIGRVLSAPAARGLGYGQALMGEALREIEARYGPLAVRIGAQQYLERFYQGFGFVTEGPPYDEDGIPHLIMVRPAGAAPSREAS